ncbi:diaminopimelate decarboxylase [Streptomyces sp. H27-S2]|uniref:diaminopimelate decarboxylase n=1 Tax=Streptomyces antarcticus TaxID=2996458 RepID=UPI002271B5CB|nr:diaminopimelate decarboxylase [Streptomyces sp. H27-S2]MCY0950065.1 diaminopimelate decarboxylase [Streptomyces sp. H27-S2]
MEDHVVTAAVPAGLPAGADDLSVWPASTTRLPDGDLAVGGVSLSELADRFDTPAYVLDEAEVRGRCRTYRDAFPDTDVLYAAKAFLSRAMVRWVREEGLGLDVCSAGELELAVTSGFPAERVVLHGNAKSPRDLEAALRLGVGRIVIDGPSEIARIAAAVGPGGRQKVMVRVVPGISAGGHDKIRTGTDDQKFGLSLADGSAQHAIARILGQPRLELTGLHCHIGSQITEVKPYLVALRRMVGLMARVHDAHGVALPELDLGGGHGIAYRPGEPVLDLTALARRLRAGLIESCAAAGLPVPRLAVEPGRAVAGPAGVALYRVLAVKRTGEKVFVAVDGGMSDNPRPALYGVRYAPRLIGRRSTAEPRTATVVGRHCEAGDILAADAELPGDIRPGDLLAVPVAGAYQLSMASGYNLVGRPPVIAVHEGTATTLMRRETLDDFRSRDIGG